MDLQKERRRLLDRFDETFGAGGTPRVALAPGRVNLIGEHTDYNGGLVLPMAIDRHTAVVFRPNAGATIRVFASGLEERDEFDTTNISLIKAAPAWTHYVRGTAWALTEKGVKLTGGDLFIDSDLPIGAGLSSSAAIEIATGLALLELSGTPMDPQTLAQCGQRAEHEFAGVRCGIMDQTVVACAKAGHALMLDCRSQKITHFPIHLNGCRFAVFDTGVRHRLASSEYNKRRAECESAAKKIGCGSLRDATLDDLSNPPEALTPNEEKRVRHVLTENLRVVRFATALERGNVDELGALLNASHRSLKNDYEVSCNELDALVDALTQPGTGFEPCFGARMTGGGFGGSVVALIQADKFEAYKTALAALAPGGCVLLEPGAGASVGEL